jgi:hypothetical protein
MFIGRTGKAVALLVMLGAVSCGGSDQKSCAGGAACGGDIAAGKYKISSFCASGGLLKVMGCDAGINVDLSAITVAGAVTFNADKTYQVNTTTSGTLTEVIPQSCLAGGGAQITCAQLTQVLQGQLAGAPFMSVACSGTSACSCQFVFKAQTSMESGTYSTSGTNLTFAPASGAPTASPYCASATQVTIQSATMSSVGGMGMGDMLDAKSSMVLTKE